MAVANITLTEHTKAYMLPLLTQVYPALIPEQFLKVLQNTINNSELFQFTTESCYEEKTQTLREQLVVSSIVRYSISSTSSGEHPGDIVLNLLLKNSDGQTHFVWTRLSFSEAIDVNV